MRTTENKEDAKNQQKHNRREKKQQPQRKQTNEDQDKKGRRLRSGRSNPGNETCISGMVECLWQQKQIIAASLKCTFVCCGLVSRNTKVLHCASVVAKTCADEAFLAEKTFSCADEAFQCGKEAFPCGDEALPCGDEAFPCASEAFMRR